MTWPGDRAQRTGPAGRAVGQPGAYQGRWRCALHYSVVERVHDVVLGTRRGCCTGAAADIGEARTVRAMPYAGQHRSLSKLEGAIGAGVEIKGGGVEAGVLEDRLNG